MILKLTVLWLSACAFAWLFRRASASVRHLVWASSVGASLLLPIANWISALPGAPQLVIRTDALPAAVLGSRTGPNWLLLLYAAGVAFVLIQLLRDAVAANRLTHGARKSAVPGVCVAESAVIPFAWGFFKPVIIVPAQFESWTTARQAAIVRHEAAHIGRKDIWTGLLARIACAVYWFHPLAWYAASRLRLEADRACDDAVLCSGHSDASYATDLVDVAKHFRPASLAPAAVHPSQLELRVRHILNPTVSRKPLSRLSICLALLLCLGISYPLSALVQTDEQVYKMGGDVKAPVLIHKTEPEYTPEASEKKIEGTVALSVVIGNDGIPGDIHVTRSLDPGLDANAVAAVQQWQFQPGTKQGKAVRVLAAIEVNFKRK